MGRRILVKQIPIKMQFNEKFFQIKKIYFYNSLIKAKILMKTFNEKHESIQNGVLKHVYVIML